MSGASFLSVVVSSSQEFDGTNRSDVRHNWKTVVTLLWKFVEAHMPGDKCICMVRCPPIKTEVQSNRVFVKGLVAHKASCNEHAASHLPCEGTSLASVMMSHCLQSAGTWQMELQSLLAHSNPDTPHLPHQNTNAWFLWVLMPRALGDAGLFHRSHQRHHQTSCESQLVCSS